METQTLALAFILLPSVVLAYHFGHYAGRKRAERLSAAAFAETMTTLIDVQEEVGITKDQIKAMNEKLSEHIMAMKL